MASTFTDEQLDRAFKAVTVIKVAANFGIALKLGVQKSPFRKDTHGASFSVFEGGFKFKDHADDDTHGGSWKMAQLCNPALSRKEIRNLLVSLNGEIPKALTKGQVKREVAVKRKELYQAAADNAEEIPRLDIQEPGHWSVPIRERWEAGIPAVIDQAEKLASARGWDADLIVELADAGKTSSPLLPWADAGDRRGWGWLVEKPVFKAGRLSLVSVGYHERYYIYSKPETGNLKPEREKRWVYVPSIPKDQESGGRHQESEFQKHLRALGCRIPAYPFILGDPEHEPRLCVILEGQFDAVSFAAACGWFGDTSTGIPPGVFVFGLRGVQSQKALLAGYGLWLRKYNPFVWIIGDNDPAGRKIDAMKDVKAIAAEPSFIDRLRAQGCRVHAELIHHSGCKDFNDVYKAARPSIEIMKKWAGHVGAGDFVK
ncbi:MAG TPA: hypothetical protein PKI68_01120 [Pontiellaceae bacterium]|mgnify:CR=1 FL=1|nr:hypothetical protein [Pontiellaceae bacterium]